MARGSGPTIEGRLRELLKELSPDALQLHATAKSRASSSIKFALAEVELAAKAALASMDPVAVPQNVFDPATPDVAAWTVVLALSAQPRVKLAEVAPEYGAGVYALYYVGDHPFYKVISRTETPIYVGKADPAKGATGDVRSHGDTLTRRLADHRRQLQMVQDYATKNPNDLVARGLHPLTLAEVECRKLVCAPGLQLTAEGRLISLFRPLWNSDFDVAHGISKHGDRQRKHPKSPWDVLHPGRAWADGLREDGTPFPAQLSVSDVALRLKRHVPSMKIFESPEDIIRAVLGAFRQTPALADPSTAEALEAQAEAAHSLP